MIDLSEIERNICMMIVYVRAYHFKTFLEKSVGRGEQLYSQLGLPIWPHSFQKMSHNILMSCKRENVTDW